METGSVGAAGALTQDMQIQAAQTRMIKKQLDQQGQATLQLIQSTTPPVTDGNVGRQLNVVA